MSDQAQGDAQQASGQAQEAQAQAQQQVQFVEKSIDVNDRGQVEPRSLTEVVRIGQSAVQSGALPNHIDNIHKFLVAWNILAGMGLKPMAYMSKTWWNRKTNQLGVQVECLMAAVSAHPDYEGKREWLVDAHHRVIGDENWMERDPVGAVCLISRKGKGTERGTFSLRQADAQGLTGKDNWKQQPGHMLQIRARKIALTNAFPDVCGGVHVAGYDDYEDGGRDYEKVPAPGRIVEGDTVAFQGNNHSAKELLNKRAAQREQRNGV